MALERGPIAPSVRLERQLCSPRLTLGNYRVFQECFSKRVTDSSHPARTTFWVCFSMIRRVHHKVELVTGRLPSWAIPCLDARVGALRSMGWLDHQSGVLVLGGYDCVGKN